MPDSSSPAGDAESRSGLWLAIRKMFDPDGGERGGHGGPQGRPGLPPAYVSPDPESSVSPDSSGDETLS